MGRVIDRLRKGILWSCRGLQFGVGVLNLDESDILLVSYPRSGSTWVRHVLCSVACIKSGREGAIDLADVDSMMPELGRNWLWREGRTGPMPRVVKTHSDFFPGATRARVVLLVRDPRDVMLSYYRFMMHHIDTHLSMDFAQFARSTKYGFSAWFRHYESWITHAWSILRYERLKSSPLQKFEELLIAVGVDVERETVRRALEWSTAERVESARRRRDIARGQEFSAGFRFARANSVNRWRHELPVEVDAMYCRMDRIRRWSTRWTEQ